MERSAKISISLPCALLRDVEHVRAGLQESRSDFFQRAAESLLRENHERDAVARYVQGYVSNPESALDDAWGKLGEAQIAEGEW